MYGVKNAERNVVFAAISQSNMESSMSGSLFFAVGGGMIQEIVLSSGSCDG